MVDWIHCADCKKPTDIFGLDKDLQDTCISCAGSLRDFFASDAPEEVTVLEQPEISLAIEHGCFIESDPYSQTMQDSWRCPHCERQTGTWFDRTIQATVVDGVVKEEGMFTRCIDCGGVVS